MKKSLRSKLCMPKILQMNKINFLKVFFMFLVFILLFLMPHSPIQGVQERQEPLTLNDFKVMHSEAHILDAGNVTSFFDETVPTFLDEWKIAGITISVVKKTTTLFAKGYGFADKDKQISIDANRTLFAVGSISKTVTATAVMQLVEKGLLDLNVDINKYLTEFKVLDTFSEPITLHHLLTHTAGFEDTYFSGSVDSNGNLRTYEEILTAILPARIWAPGEIVSYSNYGILLAGYIVQEVSGKPFVQYVKENILTPLGMKMSTFEYPIPLELASQKSKGYIYNQGSFNDQPWQVGICPPSGALASTAGDMAKFMLTQLNNGTYNESQILQSATIEQMQSPQFIAHSSLPGVCYGFWEELTYDYRAIEHDGDSLPFHSKMVLLPEIDVGIFFSINTYNLQKSEIMPNTMTIAKNEFYNLFMDYFFPQKTEVPSITPVPNFQQRVNRFIGDYRITVLPRTSFEKSILLLGYDETIFKVSAFPNGTLHVIGKNMIEVENNVFQEVGGNLKVAFIEDDIGRIVYAYSTIFIGDSLERIEWYDSPDFIYALLFFSILIFLTVIIGFPASIAVNKIRKRNNEKFPISIRRIRLTVWISSLLSLLTMGLYLVWLLTFDFSVAHMQSIVILSLVPLIAFIGSVLSLALTLIKWWREREGLEEKSDYWSIARTIHFVLFLFANLSFIVSMQYWNLI